MRYKGDVSLDGNMRVNFKMGIYMVLIYQAVTSEQRSIESKASSSTDVPDTWKHVLQKSGHEVDEACQTLLRMVAESRGEKTACVLVVC